MFLTAVFVLFIGLLYLFINRYNKVSYIFGLYFLSIIGLVTISSLYISKLSNYSYTFNFDYIIFLMLSRAKISFFSISRLYNCFIALYMFSAVLLLKILYKHSLMLCTLLFIPIMYFFFISDPAVSWNIFRLANDQSSEIGIFLSKIDTFIPASNDILIALYSLLPIFILVKSLTNTTLNFKKKYYFILIVCVLFIVTLVYFGILHGFFRNLTYTALGLTKYPQSAIQYNSSFTLPILLIISVFIVIFLTLYYKPFIEFSFFRKREVMNNTRSLNKNLNLILHTYKNAFLSVDRISDIIDRSLEKNDMQTVHESLSMLKTIADERTTAINQTLSLFRNIYLDRCTVDMEKLIKGSIEKSCISKSTTVTLNSVDYIPQIPGDEKYLDEALVNIFNNAAQSLESCNRENPKIDVTLSLNENYLIISICDNGNGVTKSELKHIFMPFYSSKSPLKNSGVGLNCVQYIVKLHHGYIEVKSKSGEYFDIRLILPTAIASENSAEKIFGGR